MMTKDTAADANFAGFGAGDNKSPLKRWIMLFFSFLFVAGISSLATASQPIFAIEKSFCAGVPSASAMASPQSCTLATQVAQGDPVYYVISITSPWGQPQQVVDLSDQFPAGFVPTPGGLFCKDNLGNPVPFSPNTLPMTVTLNMAQTIHCFIPGTYQNDPGTPGDDTGNKKNTGKGKNRDGYTAQADVQSTVLQTNPLGSDLSVTKSSSGPIDITSGPATITYTITITNNGPADVDIGDWFTLHDNLSLPPSSVPFNVDYVGSSCVVNSANTTPSGNAPTDCLDPNDLNLVNGSPLLVGTMAPKPFFNWTFAPGKGHMNAGESITLTITVKVSQLQGIDCYAAANADGLRNTVFFTLINPQDGSAFADSNPSNNTASVTTGITTGQTLEDPDCGISHLRVTKKQINPIPIINPVGWGMPVTYEIRIQNVSVPNQAITIKKTDMQDWITEGINTPPFNRQHVVTKCVASSPSAICSPFLPGINVGANPFQYSYYGHTDKAWDNSAPVKLPANGDWVTFHTTFQYIKPDCETVPNANPKPIFNTVKVRYMATAFGSSSTAPQNVVFNQEATAQTNMKPQPPCNFRVTKVMHPNSPAKVQFGVQMTYIVRFTNLGNPRTVGTIMDAGRISIPGYATGMPFSSSWNCTKSLGVTGNGPLIGSNASGSLNNTATPAMGAHVVLNLGNNIYFPTNGTITCNVSITIKRPPFNDPYCTTDDAYFENMAMMDVTHPFNTNIFWPAAGTFNPSSMTNPVPQDRNWAMARNMLPKCWDAHVEKSASVGGLPANTPAWTYAGNTNPVNFAITTTNDADSDLGSTPSPGNGWIVIDTVSHFPNIPVPSPAYTNANNQQGSPVCSPLGWCWSTGASNDGKKQIGIKKLTPGANGVWNIKNLGPWTTGIKIRNCAEIKPLGDRTGGDWYDNRANDLAHLKSCVDVPVVETTKISVRKQVIDQTGAGVTAMGAFGFSVACSPYAIPTAATSTFNLSTNSTGFSNYQSVTPVARLGSCVVTETSKPAIPAAMATKCGGAGNVIQASNSPVTLASLAAIDNPVTITNTYSCKPPTGSGQLEVIKSLTTPVLPVLWPATTWTINTNCTPAGSASSVSINTPASGNAVITSSGIVTAPIGANCTVTEPTPTIAFSNFVNNYCSKPANGGGTPIWDEPTYTVNGVTTTTPPTVGITAGVQTVTVNNAWHCGVSTGSGIITITKDISGPINGILNAATFNMGVNCAPSGANSTVTLASVSGGLWQGTVSVASGDTCTFTETPPAVDPAMTNHCAGQNGQIAYWDPPTYFNGQTKTGNGGAQTFGFVNTWHCGPPQNGQVQIFKRVFGPTQQIPAMPFVINSNCTTPSVPASVTITTASQGGGGAVTAPVGTGCQFAEPQPTTYSSAQTAYCSAQNGAVPQWAAPSYSIAQPMTVTSALQNLFVTNDWSCVQPTTPGTIKVYKLVYGPSMPGMVVPQMPQQTYGFDSNCASPSTPASVSITTIANGISSIPFVAPVGTTCGITETMPTPFPQIIIDFCTNLTPSQLPKWEAPTFSIAQPMTSTTSAQTVVVTNNWKCSINGLKVKPKKKSKFKFNIGIGIGGGGGGDKPRKPRDPQPR
jgi:Domain of unknown function DUF11/Domain of unknown function (DUF5979)